MTIAEQVPFDDNRFRCLDCGIDTSSFAGIGEYYTVHDHIWPLEPHAGMLCIGCLEKRIGRRLTVEDFDMSAPVNQPAMFPGMYRSPRIMNRLGLDGRKTS